MKFFEFWRKVYSEKDGTPSASRITMGWNATVSAAVLIILALAVYKGDEHKASVICASLALIIGALATYIGVTYGLNRGFKDKPSDEEKPPDAKG